MERGFFCVNSVNTYWLRVENTLKMFYFVSGKRDRNCESSFNLHEKVA